MAKKPNIRKQITEGKVALKELMSEHLAEIADSIISRVMTKLADLPESRRMNAIVDITPVGQASYKEQLLEAMAFIASDALEQVRKEIPNGKRVKLAEWNEHGVQLGEYESLPVAVRNKISKSAFLLFDTQLADLQKAIFFQFSHSVDSTDSMDLIRADLEEAAEDYVTGNAIEAGAGSIAAQVINDTRTEFLDSDEAKDEIEAYEFVNGDPVSPICQDLAGTVFDKDDPNRFRYTPPLHFNCKSYIVPILKGNLGKREVKKLAPSTQKLEDSIQFSEAVCCGGHVHIASVEK